jgi:hypothetical protein
MLSNILELLFFPIGQILSYEYKPVKEPKLSNYRARMPHD